MPRRGRISCWHISLCTLSLGRYADLEAVDLVGFSAGVFGRDASKAWLLPPAPVDDRDRNAPASPFTTHVRVFLDRRGRPMELGIDDVDKLLPWDALDLRSEVFRT